MVIPNTLNKFEYQPMKTKFFITYKFFIVVMAFIVCILLQSRLSETVLFPMRLTYFTETIPNGTFPSSNLTQLGRHVDFGKGNNQSVARRRVSEADKGNGVSVDTQKSETNGVTLKLNLPIFKNRNTSAVIEELSKPTIAVDHGVHNDSVPRNNGSQPSDISDLGYANETGISETALPGNVRTKQSDVIVDKTSRAPHLFITISHQLGRLGNNMFEYASLLGIARDQGRRPFVNPYSKAKNLSHVFNLTHVAFIPECGKWKRVEEKKYATFDPVFSNLPEVNLTLIGYVQSWKYFHGIEDEIRREFTFMTDIRLQADTIHSQLRKRFQNIIDPVFVGVHVRMKDFCKNPCPQAPISYFKKAFSKMKELLPGKELIFLLASNNIEWCREAFPEPDVTILEDAEREVHLAVLAMCQHMIVSVGTFGWWAGWLTGGHVIYYDRYSNKGSQPSVGLTLEDYYPPSWTAVGH